MLYRIVAVCINSKIGYYLITWLHVWLLLINSKLIWAPHEIFKI